VKGAEGSQGTNVIAVLCVCVIVLAAAPVLRAQSSPVERTFPASKTAVESKLRELSVSSGGRLPILEGFVTSNEPSLERYQQGYYQYSIGVNAIAPGETQLRVTAKITAWYRGDDQAHSGYRVLASNGRLESDLLDRLQQEFTVTIIDATTVPGVGSTASLPDKPSPALSGAKLTGSLSLPRPSNERFRATSTNEPQLRELREQLSSLQEILQNQTHPDDLAAVKASGTPILQSAVPGAHAVLFAEAEDEFQIIEIRGDWVHVRISGLSRGWIQRSQVELAAGFGSASRSGDHGVSEEPAFRKSREETSTFPGSWEALRGKQVKIVWVQPMGDSAQSNRANYAKSIFQQTYSEISEHASDVSGVVIVFDSKDGGMAAATLPALQKWAAGHLTDNAFWKSCWFDPADAFNLKD
jgi:hypothetical protein